MRKLGEALKAVVSEAYDAETSAAPRGALMNANRRRVFEHVAWHPCCTVADVTRALRLSGATAAWHLHKLVEAEYVNEVRVGRVGRYLASGLGLDPEEVAVLAALAHAISGQAFAIALTTPGLTAEELAGRLGRKSARRPLRALVAASLVVPVVDGRYRRYYPGPAVSTLEKNAGRRMRDFRRRLLRRLEGDRLAPQVRTAPGDVLEVDVVFGDERATMRLPMGSLLATRLGGVNLI